MFMLSDNCQESPTIWHNLRPDHSDSYHGCYRRRKLHYCWSVSLHFYFISAFH